MSQGLRICMHNDYPGIAAAGNQSVVLSSEGIDGDQSHRTEWMSKA